ncbi:restriction endonuclease subunit S [uncultured Methanobrevibacter sp.]|uniref:restriction endonuclease subunit S n=1 Tax=uncultured Methanobrevibacter sp. TaxID=253161 RepID=UPI002614EF61|nr:restriction endonuclease subunit S [uncultured Methanobrevibacter sp.]
MYNEQWRKVRFGEFFDMLPTNTLSRDKLNDQQGEYQNIHYGDVLIKYPFCLDCNNADIPYINDDVKFNMAVVRDGDVIFADTAEDDTVGKCVEVMNVGDRKIVSGLHTYFCRPRHKMALGYLGYYLNSNHFHNQLLPYIAGSKVSSVNRTSIARTFISYPESLTAQRRIAAILASADKVIASTQKVIAKYKQIKQGLMEDLLKPKEGWKMVKLGEVIVDSYAGGTPNRGRGDYFGGDIPWVSSGEVNNPEINSTFENITIEGLNNSSAKWIPENSILVALYGATAGQVSMLRIRATSNQAVLAIIPNDEVADTMFLYYQIVYNKENLLFLAQGSGQPNLSKNLVDKLEISIPDLTEQQRIASILSGIDAKIAAEETVLGKYGKIKKGMMERMLEGENNLN